jgi:hypothetical protein
MDHQITIDHWLYTPERRARIHGVAKAWSFIIF